MGISPTSYYYGNPTDEYYYDAEYEAPRDPESRMDATLFRGYSLPWDSIFPIGIMGAIYVLWTLGASLVIDFLQYFYIVQWQMIVNVCFAFIELGLLVIFLVVSCYFAWCGDADAVRLKVQKLKVGRTSVILARRSRVAMNGDLILVLVGLSFVLWEVTMVSCFSWGSSGNAWLTKSAISGATVTSPLYTVNYPLTSAHWGSTLNARMIEQAKFRSDIYLFILIKGIVIMCTLFISRWVGIDTADRKMTYLRKYIDAGRKNVKADEDFVMHVAGAKERNSYSTA
jgi:hypothetical protein